MQFVKEPCRWRLTAVSNRAAAVTSQPGAGGKHGRHRAAICQSPSEDAGQGRCAHLTAPQTGPSLFPAPEVWGEMAASQQHLTVTGDQ